MPLTFAQAYAIVCPSGEKVLPKSKEYNDIRELMRQSGWLSLDERLNKDRIPNIPRNIQETRRFSERVVRNIPEGCEGKPPKISKHEWMCVAANREKFLCCLNKK